RFKGDSSATGNSLDSNGEGDAVEDHVGGENIARQADTKFEEEYFDDSSIYKYVLSSSAHAAEGLDAAKKRDGAYPNALDDGELAIAYSMHLHPRFPELLAAAGKNGRAAVHRVTRSANPEQNDSVMFSFR